MKKGSIGIARLARVIDSRMTEHIPSGLQIDFAEILEGYGLKCNTFSEIIPASDYMVCRQLTIGNTGDPMAKVETTEGEGTAFLPEKMRKIKPGDHVVMAGIQDTPVVIDIIVKADAI